jgi:hypothetical protein
MAKIFVVCITLVLSLADPGILVGFTPDIVNSVLKGTLPKIEEALKAMVLPGFEMPVVSSKGMSTDLTIENIFIKDINLVTESTGLTFKSSREVVLNIPDLLINLRFDWSLKSHSSKKVLQKGDAKIIVSQASFITSLLVTTDMKQALKLNKCEFSIDKILIELDDNPASGALNWILDAVNRKLKKNIEKEMNSFLNNLVESLLKKMPSLDKNSWVSLGPWLLLNSRITEPLSISPSRLEARIDGTFIRAGPEYEINVESPGKLLFESKETMAVYISEYTVNTLALAQFKAQPFQLSSDSLGAKLTTSSLNSIFPSIVEDFGEDTPCTMTCTQIESLDLTLNPNHIESSLHVSCNLETSSSKVLSLLIDLDLEVTLSANNGLMTGSVTKLVFSQINLSENHLSTEPDMENLRAFAKGLQFFLRSFLSSKLFGSGILLPDVLISYFPDVSVEIQPGQILLEGNPQGLS